MIIVECRSGDHEPMRMESGGCNWSRSVAEEAGIWFEIGHGQASIDVEDLDAVFLCSTMHMLV